MDSGDHPEARDDEREVLDVGARRALPRWVSVVGVAILVVVAGLLLDQGMQSDETSPSGQQQTPAVPTGSEDASGQDSAPPYVPQSGPPVVREVGHRILGVAGDWEVFGYSGDRGELVRIQLAKGRITRTAAPRLQSSGPLSFLVGPAGALIHPLDDVAGYVVPDGHRARRQRVTQGGLALPGPRAGQIWVQSGDGPRFRMKLVGWDGRESRQAFSVPFGNPWPVAADGRGYVLASGTGGMYVVRPDGPRRVTTGTVIAAGPTAFLLIECDHEARCYRIAVDRGTGARQRLGRANGSFQGTPGVVSPDGSTAAVVYASRELTLHLVDLATGVDRLVHLGSQPVGGSSLAWSPDSRWLFFAAQHLKVVDTEQHRIIDLGENLGLSDVSQVAVRTSS